MAVAVRHEDSAPLRAAEFDHDEGFRVLRRFLVAYHIEQCAPLLQEARVGRARVPPSRAAPRA